MGGYFPVDLSRCWFRIITVKPDCGSLRKALFGDEEAQYLAIIHFAPLVFNHETEVSLIIGDCGSLRKALFGDDIAQYLAIINFAPLVFNHEREGSPIIGELFGRHDLP